MRKKKIKEIEKELRDKKVEILNRLMKGRSDYLDNLKNEGGDLADEASEVIERELIYDLSVNEKKEVDLIIERRQRAHSDFSCRWGLSSSFSTANLANFASSYAISAAASSISSPRSP